VSLGLGGVDSNGASSGASISADGRWVVFGSLASNLVNGDANGQGDVFIRDMQLGVTSRVSVDSSGGEADGTSFTNAISADGRFVAFASDASNLVANDVNGVGDVFLRDLQTGTTTLISRSSSGAQGDLSSGFIGLSVSSDGRYVAFASEATNFELGDDDYYDVYVRDTLLGLTRRASVSASGPSNVGDSWNLRSPATDACARSRATPSWCSRTPIRPSTFSCATPARSRSTRTAPRASRATAVLPRCRATACRALRSLPASRSTSLRSKARSRA
jgi:Tol biopolymer transport system component